MNAAIVPFDQDARGITDQGAQIDAYRRERTWLCLPVLHLKCSLNGVAL